MSATVRRLRTLRDIIGDERVYIHAKYYQKDALKPPQSKDGSLVTFMDCPARHLNDYKNPYAEVDQQINLCWLSDAVRFMYGDKYNRSAAFCLRNLACGCCPNGFGNPLPFVEEPRE